MRLRDTIGFRLTAAFVLLFLVLFAFGLFGLRKLDAFNRESTAIRERWLKSTRYLGDINNFTSDFRALEASVLLAPASSDVASLLREAAALDTAIARSQRDYEELAHDREELRLYGEFERLWRAYRNETQRVLATKPGQRDDDALSVYLNASRSIFAQATDLLDRLGALTNDNAQAASRRAEGAIEVGVELPQRGGDPEPAARRADPDLSLAHRDLSIERARPLHAGAVERRRGRCASRRGAAQ